MSPLRKSPALLVSIVLIASLAACSAGPEPVIIHVSDFMLDQPDLVVTGPTVVFEVINEGPTPHNVSVRDADGTVLMATRDLSTGESETVSAELPPGDYITFCSLAGHESLGVRGTLRVLGP